MQTNTDIETKTIVITGATSGIGFAATKKLTAMGATVLAVGRSAEKCNQAREIIFKETPHAKIEFLLADLSSQQQVKQLGVDIKNRIAQGNNGKIDVLINNAGAVANWYMATEDGYELQFAVNHLAPLYADAFITGPAQKVRRCTCFDRIFQLSPQNAYPLA